MANLLYVVHRLPYPPDKGDKVRSYHLLRHLCSRHRVFLGTFVDDPDDLRHLPQVRAMCAGVHAVRLDPRRARVESLAGLATGEALTLRYYRDAGLTRWVRDMAESERIDAAVAYSSSVVPYIENLGVPTVVDFVDVDSAKWGEYAGRHAWPMSWLYRREAERLLAYERAAAARAGASFFSTEKEAALFRSLAPECAERVEGMDNGVDAAQFSADPARASPYAAGETPIAFTGAMDYWPNVDAVTWFAAEALPRLAERFPALRFHIVGRNPAPAVRALAGPKVHVTGTVPDVRPWLQHAAVVVAPLRLARGIQNKILEAMAMDRPVVAAAACAAVMRAAPGRDLLVADDAQGFVDQVAALLDDPRRAAAIGAAARGCVLREYSWDAHLAAFDRRLAALMAAPASPRTTARMAAA
jgi:sugar transferase (PEP-CTERM/EpsH1 system associated)